MCTIMFSKDPTRVVVVGQYNKLRRIGIFGIPRRLSHCAPGGPFTGWPESIFCTLVLLVGQYFAQQAVFASTKYNWPDVSEHLNIYLMWQTKV